MHSKHKWITFKITDDMKKIVVDRMGDPNPTEDKDADHKCFEDLMDVIPKDHVRYIIYEFGFMSKDGRKIKEIAFIFW